ncbi:hypothetical protein ACLOJK_029911 [Asimina triloba]
MVVVAEENPRSPRIGDVDVEVLPSIAGDWLSALGKQRPKMLENLGSVGIVDEPTRSHIAMEHVFLCGANDESGHVT